MKNAQDILNEVVAHMRKQGRQSNAAGPGSSCRYRSPDGAKCAVGCLIPDENYSPGIEGRSVQSAAVAMVLMDLNLQGHEGLLRAMQAAHDCPWGGHELDHGEEGFHFVNAPPFLEMFEKRARKIAESFRLEYPEVQ